MRPGSGWPRSLISSPWRSPLSRPRCGRCTRTDTRFSSLTITIAFAAYALGVVTSLIVVGHVSDWLGRKPVLVAAIGIEVASTLFFIYSTNLPWLIAGRVVSGLGAGAIAATATAFLHELHAKAKPHATQRRFDVISGTANLGGLGLGTLIAGALAQWVSSPLRTPYLAFLGLLVISAALLAAVAPETIAIAPNDRPRYHPQRPRVSGSPLGWSLAATAAVSSFAIFGLFTSLAPGFVGGTLGHPSPMLAGTVPFLMFGAAPLAQFACSRLAAGVQLAGGIVGELAGLALLATGMEIKNLGVFIASAVVLGAGAGVLFRSALGRTIRVSPPASRGESLAALFLMAYLGLIGPAVGVGIATQYISATTAMLYFASILGGLLLLTAVLAPAAQRADSAALSTPH